jgi:hypothetical protein
VTDFQPGQGDRILAERRQAAKYRRNIVAAIFLVPIMIVGLLTTIFMIAKNYTTEDELIKMAAYCTAARTVHTLKPEVHMFSPVELNIARPDLVQQSIIQLRIMINDYAANNPGSSRRSYVKSVEEGACKGIY